MALFNQATREFTAKVVYYGPGLGGKTTNLRFIHDRLSFKTKGRLVSLATQDDRTLFFDFLPLEPGPIRGLQARLQLYAVPGRVSHESALRAVLRGCDAVVFVADSRSGSLDANAESLRGLRQHLLANELDPALPQVFQYNKRDLPDALPVARLEAQLNPRGLPSFEAVAIAGVGVEDTLRATTELLLRRLADGRSEARDLPGPAAATSALAVPAREDPPPSGNGLRPDQWLYLLDGVQHGPIGVDELVDLLLSSIPEDTKVWRPGLDGWQRAGRVGEIAAEIPPPLPHAL
jgi:signal recognition particle receptor subunit beta